MNDSPPFPAPARHPVEIASGPGPWGGLTRTYRSARIEANDKDTLFGLFLDGHPMHGTNMGNWENMVRLIDARLDRGELPPPYRVAAPPRP